MNFFRKVQDMINAILPWPSPGERRKAIHAARKEKETSQAGAKHAAVMEAQFKRIVQENHFAESLARQIMRRENREHNA
jgi:hypothetical protein